VNRHHALSYRLLGALLAEDREALDRTVSTIQTEQVTEQVLCAIAAMLTTALVNAHGPAGALAQVDQSMAALSEWSA
jgi:hypothetical protein